MVLNDIERFNTLAPHTTSPVQESGGVCGAFFIKTTSILPTAFRSVRCRVFHQHFIAIQANGRRMMPWEVCSGILEGGSFTWCEQAIMMSSIWGVLWWSQRGRSMASTYRCIISWCGLMQKQRVSVMFTWAFHGRVKPHCMMHINVLRRGFDVDCKYKYIQVLLNITGQRVMMTDILNRFMQVNVS